MSSDSPGIPARIRIRRRVERMDTDAAGIYQWSTVIRSGRSRPWPDPVRAALTGGGERQPEG